MEYIVEITEILQKRIIVVADDKEKAKEMAEDIWFNCDEVLTAEDFKEVTFEIIEEE